MADGTVTLTDDASNTGKALDHENVTFGSAPTARYRPRVQLVGAGVSDIILPKALPTNGLGQLALPVWPNAIQTPTYLVAANRVASGTLTANTRKDILAIYHAATSTKTVKIRRIIFSGYATTAVAGTVELLLYRGTSVATAGTTITILPTIESDTVPPDVAARQIPTITNATLFMGGYIMQPATATANTTIASSVVVYDWQESGETKPLILRPSFSDAICLALMSTAAVAVTFYTAITLTEE